MKKIYLNSLFCTFTLFISAVSTAAVRTSAATGNWNVGATWVGGVAPVAGDDAIIAAGHTVTLTAAASITNVTVNGTLTSNFALTVNAAGTFTINAGGTYIHNNTTTVSTSIFRGTESFNATSTFQVNNWQSLGTPLVNSCISNFGHLILNWNTGVSVWNNNGLGVTRTIQGNFTIQNTCGTYLNSVAGNITIPIGGNLSILTNGYLECKRSASGNVTMNVAGNTTISGTNSIFYGVVSATANATGTFTFTTVNYTQSSGVFMGTEYGANTAGGSATITVSGTWTHSGGEHRGIDYPYGTNMGISTYNIGTFNLTGGTVVFHSTTINDGRTVTVNCTNDFSAVFSAASDGIVMVNIIGAACNALLNFTVGRDLILGGNTTAYFASNAGVGNETVTISRHLTITGATVRFNPINNAHDVTMNIANNLSISGAGTSYLSQSTTAGSLLTCSVGGNVTISGGTNTTSTVSGSQLNMTLGTAAVNWNQTGGTMNLCSTNIKSGKTVTLTGTSMGSILSGHTITVESGANLYMSTAVVGGAGAFTNQATTTLGIGHSGGITSAGATGNVQVTGTRTYTSNATYEYYGGQTPQSTGNFTTTTTSGTYPAQVTNMIINKTLSTNVVNLTNSTDIINSGTLTLTTGILTTSYNANTAPWIRIPSGSTVSPAGGSANSYVDGYIRKQGNTAFSFPTGNSGYWMRIDITAPSAVTEFEARYIRTPYTNTTSMAAFPTVLDHVSLYDYWMLSKPGGADAATVNVNLHWENASLNSIYKFDSLCVARWNGTGWENTNCYTGCPANWTTSTAQRTYAGSVGVGAGSIQSNTVSSFSPFTFGSIGSFPLNPLPVTIISFEAFPQYNNVLLNWVTASEINNDYFTVERSSDGIHFTEVGTLDSKAPGGNSSQVLDYSLVDEVPLAGFSYYRLKQTDIDDKFSYSNLVAVNFNPADNGLLVAPNPANTNNIVVSYSSGSGNTNTTISIYDVTGQIVYKQNVSSSQGENAVVVDVSGLSKGMYFICVSDENTSGKTKLIRE